MCSNQPAPAVSHLLWAGLLHTGVWENNWLAQCHQILVAVLRRESPCPGLASCTNLGWHAALLWLPLAPASQWLAPRILSALAAALVPEDKELATRLHSQTMLNKLAPIIPGFWGGSAGEQERTALQDSG